MKGNSLPQGWKVDKLGNIAEVNTGNPAPQGKQFFEDGHFPFVRVQDLGRYGQTTNLTETTDKVNERARKECGLTLFPKGTILFPKSGMSTLLNHRAILGVDAYVVSHLAVLIPKKGIIGEYLYYYLCTIDMARWSQRTNLPSLRTSIISEIDIPVPPLPVQERIMAILNKANAIQQKRQEALRIAEQIIPCLFLEMFGEPWTNPKHWRTSELSKVAKINPNEPVSNLENESFAFVPMENVDERLGIIRKYETKLYHEMKSGKTRFRSGDILFAKITPCVEHKKTAIVKDTPTSLCFGSTEFYVVRCEQDLNPCYLWQLLRTNHVCDGAVASFTGSTGRQRVPKSYLENLIVPIPPIETQNEYEIQVNKVLSNYQIQSTSLEEANHLSKGLLFQSFTGELTASWEAELAEEIATQVAVLERLPRITLLAFIRRVQQQMRQRAVLVTALMKYAFLFQMEGKSRQPVYNFVPYKFGPFAKEVYSDLNTLQDEGLLSVKKEGRTASREDVFRVAEELATYRTAKDEYYIEISIPYGKEKQVDATIEELDNQMLDDIDSIISSYGRLDHDALLDIVYEKYPRFARKSQRRRRRYCQEFYERI